MLTLLAAIANLGPKSRGFKIVTFWVAVAAVAMTSEVWLHMLLDEGRGPLGESVTLGLGAWVAMLGFAA